MTLRHQLMAAAAVGVICVGGALYWNGRHDEAKVAAPKIEHADDNAAARGLEAQGAQESTARVETTLRTARAVQEKTHDYVTEARAAGPGAPLDAASARRLRAHDQFLCHTSPGACPAAPGGDAVDSQ